MDKKPHIDVVAVVLIVVLIAVVVMAVLTLLGPSVSTNHGVIIQSI